MKKILTFFTLTTLFLSLVACGNSSDNNTQQNPNTENTTNSGNSQNQQSTYEGMEASITETVLVDEAGVKITAKGLNADALMGPELKLFIENNSGQDLTFQCNDASINGYMVDTIMSVDVVSGKKANESLIFSSSDLELSGIETIADLEFEFHIFTTSDWDDYLDTDSIQIKTSVASSYEYSFDDSGNLVYNDQDVKIVVKGLAEESSLYSPGIIVYIENNSDDDITVQTRDVSINGFMVDAIFSSEVEDGKRAVDAITFLTTDLEENAITGIENIELSFHIFDSDDWETIVDTDVVTLSF